MKPNEYVKKYRLKELDQQDNSFPFSYHNFIKDLSLDFKDMVVGFKHSGTEWNIRKFKTCVNDIRKKWDSINNKSVKELPNRIWNAFYATCVCQIRDQEFPDWSLQEKKRKERKKKQENPFTYVDIDSDFSDNFSNWINIASKFFNSDAFTGRTYTKPDVNSILRRHFSHPERELKILGLVHPVSIKEIKTAYRDKVHIVHPDKGGTTELFTQVTEAYKKCILHYGEA